MSWRDLIKIHPAADLFPMMSDAELDELATDIAKNGPRLPLVFCGNDLLDGRNRLAAIDRIPDQKRRDGCRNWALENAEYLEAGDDPHTFVISANIQRRHLTGEQKRQLIAQLLTAHPERSDRATAQIAKVDHKTVAAVRAEVEATGEIPQLKERTGADGKARAVPPQMATLLLELAERKEVQAERAAMSMQLSSLLQLDPGRTVEEIIRQFKNARRDIQNLPMEKRLAFARGLLRALEVSLEDLNTRW